MGLETIRMRDLEGRGLTIFETVSVMSKRARHINNLRVAEREEILDGRDDADEILPEEANVIDTTPVTKVATIAVDEFLDNKLEFNYIEPMKEEEDEVEKIDTSEPDEE